MGKTKTPNTENSGSHIQSYPSAPSDLLPLRPGSPLHSACDVVISPSFVSISLTKQRQETHMIASSFGPARLGGLISCTHSHTNPSPRKVKSTGGHFMMLGKSGLVWVLGKGTQVLVGEYQTLTLTM